MQSNGAKEKATLKERVHGYSLKVITLIDQLPRDVSCQIIGKQLLRSATSVGANVMEAQAGSSRRDFTNFFSYALKSANESSYWLGLLRDSGKLAGELINGLCRETEEIANMLGASILTLKGRR